MQKDMCTPTLIAVLFTIAKTWNSLNEWIKKMWCIYTDKTVLEKDTCTCMFIAALFTIGKTWKQPKCPSTDECIKKMWYIYTMEYYSL